MDRRPLMWLLFGGAAWCCTPQPSATQADSAATDVETKRENSQTKSDDEGQDSEGARLLAEYLAGTHRLTAGAGPSYLVGKSPGPCVELPAKRPANFHISFTEVRAGHGERPALPTWHAVGENECEVVWTLLHIGKPAVECARYTPAVLDEFYQHLRALHPHNIRTEKADQYAAIHRGGVSVFWHWAGHACEVSDEGSTQVTAADEGRFREFVSWVRGAATPRRDER